MKSLIDLQPGDRVKYRYPDPQNDINLFFEGEVYMVGEGHIFIKSGDGIILRVSYGNFGNLEYIS